MNYLISIHFYQNTQINKVYAAYAKELSLPIKTFNNQEYVKVFEAAF